MIGYLRLPFHDRPLCVCPLLPVCGWPAAARYFFCPGRRIFARRGENPATKKETSAPRRTIRRAVVVSFRLVNVPFRTESAALLCLRQRCTRTYGVAICFGGVMFRKILVAIDGSQHAREALDIATDMAQRYGAALGLLHAFPHVSDMLGYPQYDHLLEARTLIGK